MDSILRWKHACFVRSHKSMLRGGGYRLCQLALLTSDCCFNLTTQIRFRYGPAMTRTRPQGLGRSFKGELECGLIRGYHRTKCFILLDAQISPRGKYLRMGIEENHVEVSFILQKLGCSCYMVLGAISKMMVKRATGLLKRVALMSVDSSRMSDSGYGVHRSRWPETSGSTVVLSGRSLSNQEPSSHKMRH